MLRAANLQDAKNHIANQDYGQALEILTALISQPANARNAEINKYYGQALCMTGRYAESLAPLEVGAKGNKSGAWWYLGISQQHLYRFSEAIESLEKYKSLCSKDSPWIARTDSIIAECQIGQKGVAHVQDIVIIDSMMVPRQSFFEYYRLGGESGKVRSDNLFENQDGNYRLWADKDDEGTYHLYEQHKFGNDWGEAEIIESIESEDYALCYPFLRSDSETLFFSSNRTPGFGGFDIYKTHYNADSEQYFAPERMGMPFNSPFDDYLLAIDETHMVGWWATNRNAAAGEVCIYLFKVDEQPQYLTGLNPERACVTSIRDTWKEDIDYAAYAEEVRNAPQRIVKQEKLFIPISDAVVYTSLDQFQNSEARDAYELSVTLAEELQRVGRQLDQLRESWHTAPESRKSEWAGQIRQTELKQRDLSRQYLEARKTYVRIENNR